MLWQTLAVLTTLLRLGSLLSAAVAFGGMTTALMKQETNNVRSSTVAFLALMSTSLALLISSDLLTTEVLWTLEPSTCATTQGAALAVAQSLAC